MTRTAGAHEFRGPDRQAAPGTYPSGREVGEILMRNRIFPGASDPHGLAHGLLGLEPLHPHSSEYMDAYQRGTDSTRRVANIADQEARHDWFRERPDPEPREHAERDHAKGPYNFGNNPWAKPNEPGMPGYMPPHEDPWNTHLRTEKRQGLVGEGSLSDGSTTDGKIVGRCPGCEKPIRKHQTAHGDELRHLHNDHVRCFGKTAGGADLAGGAAAAEEANPAGAAVKGAEMVGDALNSAEKGLEKAPDLWAYRAESAFQMYADYLGRPDASNPTGRGPDEYKARTWDAYQNTHPMQSPDDRMVNTPVLPSEPIKTRNINTPTRGLEGREDDLRHPDDDENDDED